VVLPRQGLRDGFSLEVEAASTASHSVQFCHESKKQDAKNHDGTLHVPVVVFFDPNFGPSRISVYIDVAIILLAFNTKREQVETRLSLRYPFCVTRTKIYVLIVEILKCGGNFTSVGDTEPSYLSRVWNVYCFFSVR